ncbi:MAG TPA: tetratricopeptide repeat protein [Polyangiaceae bacterium]
MHRKTLVLTFCSFVFIATPALAQHRDAATAEALFRQGRQAMEAKNYDEACPKFAESQRLDPASGTLMNLATCEERVGKLASAWQHWKEAIDALPPKDDRIAFARSRVEDLEKKLPRLQITLSGGGEGAKVYRDELELGSASLGVLLPVDPGSHTVTVRMPGRFPKSVPVSVAVGESAQIDVHPGAVDPSANEKNVKLQPRPRTLGWIFGGIGVAGVGAATVTGLMLVNKKSTVETSCPDKTCTSQDGLDAVSSGKTLLVANTAAWIVGGVGLGLGAYFLLKPQRNPTTPALVPSVGPGVAALSCVGSF